MIYKPFLNLPVDWAVYVKPIYSHSAEIILQGYQSPVKWAGLKEPFLLASLAQCGSSLDCAQSVHGKSAGLRLLSAVSELRKKGLGNPVA